MSTGTVVAVHDIASVCSAVPWYFPAQTLYTIRRKPLFITYLKQNHYLLHTEENHYLLFLYCSTI